MKEQEVSRNLPLHDMTQLEADYYCWAQKI
jgi:hypothetical protein